MKLASSGDSYTVFVMYASPIMDTSIFVTARTDLLFNFGMNTAKYRDKNTSTGMSGKLSKPHQKHTNSKIKPSAFEASQHSIIKAIKTHFDKNKANHSF